MWAKKWPLLSTDSYLKCHHNLSVLFLLSESNLKIEGKQNSNCITTKQHLDKTALRIKKKKKKTSLLCSECLDEIDFSPEMDVP